jgi:hypothetical protein
MQRIRCSSFPGYPGLHGRKAAKGVHHGDTLLYFPLIGPLTTIQHLLLGLDEVTGPIGAGDGCFFYYSILTHSDTLR